LYLLSGCVDVNSHSFKKYSPAKVKSNIINLDRILVSVDLMDYEKKTGKILGDWYCSEYYTAGLIEDGIFSLVKHEYRDYYFNTQVLPLLKEFTGREYELLCSSIIAKDETVSEYVERMREGWSWWFAFFPFIGQLWFLCMMWCFIYALFTKKWSNEHV
jgi:hypothetical protein